MRYIRCPKCGLSDGNDDLILEQKLIDVNYATEKATILEKRQCDICNTVYLVEMHFKANYEIIRR